MPFTHQLRRFRQATQAVIPKINLDLIRQGLINHQTPNLAAVIDEMGPKTEVSQNTGTSYDQMDAIAWAVLITESLDSKTGGWKSPEFERILTKFFTPERMEKFTPKEQTGLLRLFPSSFQSEWGDSLPKASFLGPVGNTARPQRQKRALN